jgi:FkbM family methyltransferase
LRDGSLFLIRPGLPLGWYVTFFGSFEPELREIFRAVLPPAGVAIDIGANVGWHTLLMARLSGTHGRVLAVEPNPSVRAQLARNIRLNRLDHVDVIPYVVAETEKSLAFCGPDANDPSSGDGYVASADEARTDLLSLDARPLDAITGEARLERLDLIKIDVEGYEWPVLQGGEHTIAKWRPYIVFEFDRAYAGRGGGTPELIADFFDRHGYELFEVQRGRAQAVELSNWPNCANLLAIPTK